MIKTLIKDKEYIAIVYWGITFKTNKDSVQFTPIVHRALVKDGISPSKEIECSVLALDIDLSKPIAPSFLTINNDIIFKNV